MARKAKGRGRKKACKAVGAKVKVGGKTFTVKGYKKTKTAATAAAKKHRGGGKGKQARVAKTSCGWRVVTRG